MMASTRSQRLVRLGVIALVYITLGKLSLLMAIDPGIVSGVWPAAGWAVGMWLLYDYRIWPAIFIGATVATATTQVSVAPAMLVGIGNTLEAFTVAWLIRRFTHIADSFPHGSDVFKFILFALAGSLLGALIGSASLFAAGNVPHNALFQTWLTWFLGDLTGIAIVAPAVITWRMRNSLVWNRQKLGELALFSASFAACSWFIFSLRATPVLFLMLPFMVWLAFRFTQSEVAKANIFVATIIIVGTVAGKGPLAILPFHTSLMILQLFVSVIGMTALALAVTIDERSRTTEDLKRLHEQLEVQVQQRTAELHDAITALKQDIVIRETIQRQLLAKEKQLEEAQRLVHLGSWQWDVADDHLIMSNEMIRIYGVPPAECESLTFDKYRQYLPPEERFLVDRVVEAAMATRQPFNYEHHIRRPDGEVRYLQCSGYAETDVSGNPIMLYGTAHDVTEAKAMEASLRDAEALYRKLVELSPDAIYLLHQGRITFSNSAGLNMAGVAADTALIDRAFIDMICPQDRHRVSTTLQHMAQDKKQVAVEGSIEHGDGSLIDIELAATPFHVPGKQDSLVVARDVSERKKAEKRVQYMAHHDSLTGLANRTLYKERLDHAIAQSHRSSSSLAVLFIDLDRFKAINDTAGHSAGDEVLLECAARLRHCLRDSDTVSRAGGDEFLILIEAAPNPLHVPAVAQKILGAMARPFIVGGKEFSIGASIGISTYPADGQDVDTLIKHADIAMYRAKAEGRGNFCYYSASMSAQSLERYKMEAALRHALERGEMALYFQPKINLKTGRISGAEALIRWNHPEYGLLLPDRFISIAEDMGVIADLGLWAIGEVCKYCSDWQRQGLPDIRIAINLAYSQFADEYFFSKVEQLLHNAGLQPHHLELEITESMVMENAERLMSTLQKFKHIGVHLSVDDFGTGYSSLAYLKRLPVDSVKVDRSFIRDLPLDAEDVAITHAVLALVHSLRRTVIAEGIETREQFDFLVKHGCDEGQGFYFSRPLPERQFRSFLAEEHCFAA